MAETLRDSVLKLVAFFDCMGHLLLPEELAYFCRVSPNDVIFSSVISELIAEEKIAFFGNVYIGLLGRENLLIRTADAPRLWHKSLFLASRAARLLCFVPGVRALWVGNSVSFDAATEKSDIDVVIVVEKNKLWTARFFSHIVLRVFRMRTVKRAHAGRICLSFFLTEEGFADPLFQNEKDVYMRAWIGHLLPVYDPEKLLAVFRHSAGNIGVYFGSADAPPLYTVPQPVSSFYFQRVISFFCGAWFECSVRRIQTFVLRRRGIFSCADGGVVISPTMIKLHENDRRAWYSEAWRERCSLFGISV